MPKDHCAISDSWKLLRGFGAAKLRFGVQFERRCPGVILRDHVDETAPDALHRAKGFKGYGLRHVQRREYEEACRCFKKAHQFFHAAGDRVLRKEASEMLAEAEVLRDSSIPTPGCTVFRMIGSKPIVPMEAGYAPPDDGWVDDEGDTLGKHPKEI